MQDNPYVILEVTPESTQEEIKKSFRRLAMKHHPDRGGDEDLFKKMSSAYSFLEKHHIQRPKGSVEFTADARKSNKNSKFFYEYHAETNRWYSHRDLDSDGFVSPTTVTPQTDAQFQEALRKLRESRIGKKPEGFNYNRDWKRRHNL